MNSTKSSTAKRILVMLFCLTLVASLAACGSKKEASDSKDSGTSTSTDSGATGEKNYDKQLTVSIASLTELKDGALDNPFHKWWTDKYNIKWDYNYVPWDNWDEKLRLWIVSDDLPDVASWNYNQGDAAKYVDQGLLYKFPDDWKTRWPNVAKAYESTGLGDRLEEQFGGTYILPKPVYFENKPADPLMNQIGVIALRSDWAKAVGFPLKDAYTVQELFDFARLVKEKDPGKVGSKLVPIAFDAGDALTEIIMANAAHSRVESAFYKDASGKYVWGPADQETLTGLKDLQQAYKEKLLSPEFYTYKNGETGQKFATSGEAAITGLGGLASYRQDMHKRFKDGLNIDSKEVVHSALVLGDDGKYRNLEQPNYWSSLIFSPNISDEKFERIMDLIDYSTSHEGQQIVNMGFEGTDWKMNDKNEMESILPEGTTLSSKYPGIFEGLYVLGDDFSVVNPAIDKDFRDRAVKMYQLKAELGKKDDAYSKYDWDFQLYASKAKDQASFDYATEYTNLILQPGDLEDNWKKWVESKQTLVQPLLDELNNMKK